MNIYIHIIFRPFISSYTLLYITNRQYNFTPQNPIVKGNHLFEDRWRSCVREVDTSALSEPLGAMFIQDHFDQESRTLAEVGNELKSTFDYALNDKHFSKMINVLGNS